MKIVCIGGGPAGPDFAVLMKQLDPRHDITVVQRKKPYDTFGWGTVFSDATMDNMGQWDPATAAEIEQAFNHDWVEGGIMPDDAVVIAKAFKAAGADLIDCSSGQASKKEKPLYGRMFQTPFADRIRQQAGIPTIAVGSAKSQVESIFARQKVMAVAGGK